MLLGRFLTATVIASLAFLRILLLQLTVWEFADVMLQSTFG